MENQALDIIDALYTMIAEAWGVPLGNDKCIVERDKALGMLDDLKAVLPGELSEARRLMNAREEFVENTKREVEEIRSKAENEADQMVTREAVYQAALKRADEIVLNAETKAREIRIAASQYLDDSLHQTEDAITSALENVRQARAQFRAVTAIEPEGKVDVTMEDVEEVADMEELDVLN